MITRTNRETGISGETDAGGETHAGVGNFSGSKMSSAPIGSKNVGLTLVFAIRSGPRAAVTTAP